MSYIKRQFRETIKSSPINNFLVNEGFVPDIWHGRRCMRFVHTENNNNIWVLVFDDEEISWHVERLWGEVVDKGTYFAVENNFNDFHTIYKIVVDKLVRWRFE